MIEVLARQFRGARLPAISSGSLLDAGLVTRARDALLEIACERYELADRGAYDTSEVAAPGDVEDSIAVAASSVVGAPLEVIARRWYRMRAGDYTLAKDDRWAHEARDALWYDVSLDVSREATSEAEIVFTHRGSAFFTVPQRFGELAVVARGPTVARFDRYLTHRVGSRIVERLRLLLVARGTRAA
ncbi:MAG: hypothetical protein U0414_05565 [Polyangiaceae bacterium]